MKILFLEDHPIVVSGCRLLFADHSNVLFFGASTIAEAQEVLAKHTPDVIIVDVNLPDGSGLEFIRGLREKKSRIKVIVFSVADDAALAMQAIDLGAHGFVSKNGKATDLLTAVEAISRGERWLPDDLLQQVAFMRAVPGARPPRLTKREKDVLRLLSAGRHQGEIAKDLNISAKAVKTDCLSIRQKLKARTTAEMVAIAARDNIGK